MIERSIYFELFTHLSKKQVTIITGMRRAGKTTAIKYLMNKISSENKIYFDLEKVENRFIFQQPSYTDIEISLKIEGIDFNRKAYIALDEIQLVPEIISIIKYFYDHYNIKFILSGSSSFYLKNHFSESLAGRKRIFEISPFSFREYLTLKGESTKHFNDSGFNKFNPAFYHKYKEYYYEYLVFGGFPEVVLADEQRDKIEYLKDIINSYIELDVKLLSDFSKSTDLYKLIRLLSGRVGSKTDYSKISTVLGINRHKVRDYIEFLEYTYFITRLPAYAKTPDREISKQHKIYFSDTGLMYALGNTDMSQLLENAIANQLNNYGYLQYYEKKSGQEIDFILNGNTAFEVKESPSAGDLNTLQRRTKALDINTYHLIGLHPPVSGFTDFIWAGNI